MREPIDELYITWLYNHVASEARRSPRRTYWSLIRKMFRTEYIWLIPNDDNRVEDGKGLRLDFLDQMNLHPEDLDVGWLTIGCSVLEMLIALSKRLEFETDTAAKDWFWHILHNLGLDESTDANYVGDDAVEQIFDIVIWRRYAADGTGGLFPLKEPRGDQRKIELWYQLNAYILEMD